MPMTGFLGYYEVCLKERAERKAPKQGGGGGGGGGDGDDLYVDGDGGAAATASARARRRLLDEVGIEPSS